MTAAGTPRSTSSSRLEVRRWFSVVGVHLAVTYLLTFPAANYIGSGVFGMPRGDKFQLVWIFWWMKESMVEQGQSPFFTSLQYHPTGVSLALHDMTYFWALLSKRQAKTPSELVRDLIAAELRRDEKRRGEI